MEQVLPEQALERQSARDRLSRLEADSAKVLSAYYADAIDTDTLRTEQQRIATEKAATERVLDRVNLAEEALKSKVEICCDLLSRAHDQYLVADSNQRRDLNQAVFEKLYVVDEEIIGTDYTPAFSALLSDDPAGHLAAQVPQYRSMAHFLQEVDARPTRHLVAITSNGSLSQRASAVASGPAALPQ